MLSRRSGVQVSGRLTPTLSDLEGMIGAMDYTMALDEYINGRHYEREYLERGNDDLTPTPKVKPTTDVLDFYASRAERGQVDCGENTSPQSEWEWNRSTKPVQSHEGTTSGQS